MTAKPGGRWGRGTCSISTRPFSSRTESMRPQYKSGIPISARWRSRRARPIVIADLLLSLTFKVVQPTLVALGDGDQVLRYGDEAFNGSTQSFDVSGQDFHCHGEGFVA